MIAASLLSTGAGLCGRLWGQDAPAQQTRSVVGFGAVGDGVTLNTAAIQAAIDSLAASGGGVLQFPQGTYVTGTILLKSHVALHLSQGAVLQGSLHPEDYKPVDAFTDAINVVRGFALVAAIDAEDVALTGDGAVDGRGEELQRHGDGPNAKPFLVRWVRCAGVRVAGVTLKNSGAWTMHAFQSKDIDYRDLHIFSYGVENNDGIDVDSCERVRIDRCLVESQDDAICLKTTSAKPCRDVKVTRCTIRTHHGALKIGTESMGDIEDIEFSNCYVLDAREGAIKFCSEDGANVRRVLVSDIEVDLADTPVFLRLGGRMRTYRAGDPTLPIGSMSGIALRNIHVKDATRVGVLISGFPGHLVDDVTLSNVYIKLKGEINLPAEGDVILPEQVKSYPEVWMFGPLIPAYGAYLRHASGIGLDGVAIKVELPDTRPALVCEDLHRSAVENLQLTGDPHFEWLATLRNASSVTLDRFSFAATPKCGVRIQGAECRDIRLGRLNLPPSAPQFRLEDGARESPVTVVVGEPGHPPPAVSWVEMSYESLDPALVRRGRRC